METEKMIEELEKLAITHKNDIVGVGELNISSMCKDVASRLRYLNNPNRVLMCEHCAHNGEFEMEVGNGHPSPCTTCRVKYFDNFKPIGMKEGECYCTSCRRIFNNDKIFRRKDDPTKGICFDCY